MHEELRDELQSDMVEILAVNEIGYDNFEYVDTVSSQLPWVQDVEEVNAWDLWEITYRDLVILDQDNIFLTTYNLTDNPMWTTTLGAEAMPNESYITLKNIFRHIALYNELPPEPEPEDAGVSDEPDAGEDPFDSGAWYWPPDDPDEDPIDAFDAGHAEDMMTVDAGISFWADAGQATPLHSEDAGFSDIDEESYDAGDATSWEEHVADAGEDHIIADAGASQPHIDSGTPEEPLADSGTTPNTVMDSGSSLDLLDGAVADASDAGAGHTDTTDPMSDFFLPDGNPYSPTQGTYFSPRDNIGKVSAYYFGSGG